MQRIKLVALALVAVGVMSAAAATGAVAHTFTATEMGKLTAKATATQVFSVDGGKTVECTALKLTAGEAVLTSLTQKATIVYSGCKSFGLSATVSTAKYSFSADGTASLENTITITALGCTVTVPSAKNQGLSSITYSNNGKNVKLTPAVKNITSSGSGSTCTYSEESKGTYSGTSEVGLASGIGSVSWS